MAATKLLANTYKKILSDPIEGFAVELEDDSNLFEWKIYIEGPKETLYEGGVFQLAMKFPQDFPMNPPELKFLSDFWHPNVYQDTGAVCISILHPPGEDEMSGELPEERWLPTQSVTTILLSVISLLGSPNFSSPANVDASVQWRKEPELFKHRVQKLIDKANREKPEHIVIPHPDTNPEERAIHLKKLKAETQPMDLDDFMEDVPEEDDEDDEDASDEQHEEEEEEQSEGSDDKKKPSNKNDSNKKESSASKDKRAQGKNDEKKGVRNDGSSSQKKKKKKCIIM